MSNQLPVGIAEMLISEDKDDVLVAHNLGSCVGVAVYDESRSRGGLIHCLLPLSRNDLEKAKAKPYMYVDTGVAHLLEDFLGTGSKKEDLTIAVAGGAQMTAGSDVFEIGKKNYTILRKILWKNNLLIRGEHIGGNCSRTLILNIADGSVVLKSNGRTVKLV